MSKAQHSPTPWKLAKMAGEPTVIYYTRPDGNEPGVCSTNNDEISTRGCLRGEVEANAEFICRAVNAHEALIAALEDALAAMQAWSDEHDGADPFGLCCPNCDGAVPLPHSLGCRIRAALALAKGEK